MTTGAWSERKIAPLAAEIEQTARSSPSWPSYLDGPEYGAAVTAWARAEAVVNLLWRWLDQHAEQGLDELLADTHHEQTDEQVIGKGRSRRMTTGRRVASVLEQLRRWESAAAGHRARLGLDPLSRAKLGKDVAIGTAVAGQLDRLRGVGSELVDRFGRAALSAADKPADSTRPVDAERPVEGQPDPGHAGVGYDASEIEGGGSNGQS